MSPIVRDLQYHKFRAYGFLKNLRLFDPFLILFLRDAGLSFLAIGALVSVREISANVLEIPTGVLADVFGRRKAMLLGFAAYLLSFLLFFVGAEVWVFAAAMVAFAVGETFRSGTHKAMILEHLRLTGQEDANVAYYGKTRAASQLGSALASVLAAGLVLWTGSYRVVFLGTLVPYVLDFVLLASYPRALDGAHLEPSEHGWRVIATRFRQTCKELVRLLRAPVVLRALLSGASFDALFKTSKDYLQPVVQTQALSLALLSAWSADRRTAVLIGAIYSLVYVATSVASAISGQVHARLRSPARAVNLTLVLGPALLLLAGLVLLVGWEAAAIAAFLFVFVLQNVRRPMIVGYLAETVPPRIMATGLSVEVQLRTLLMAGIAPLLGWLADRTGVGIALASISGAMLLLAPAVRVSDVSPHSHTD